MGMGVISVPVQVSIFTRHLFVSVREALQAIVVVLLCSH